jgi:AhpD family alkylhydroperoxidase
MDVMNRANWFAVSPEGAKAIGGLHHHVLNGTNLPSTLIHLVFLRVSQINGCAHCIDIHTRDLIKEGVSVDKAVLVPVWHEARYLFTEQEQAALAWSEEVTLVSETHASDEAYAAAAAVFDEKDLVDLTLTIAAMNAINRLGVSFRLKPKARA